MRELFELSPAETKEYVDMINDGKLTPKMGQTYLEFKEKEKEEIKEDDTLRRFIK